MSNPAILKDPKDTTDGQFNINGSIREEDLFTLGDDEDDIDQPEEKSSQFEEGVNVGVGSDGGLKGTDGLTFNDDQTLSNIPKPPIQPSDSSDVLFEASIPDEKEDSDVLEGPKRHYIKRSETLVGIALKYKVDVRFSLHYRVH